MFLYVEFVYLAFVCGGIVEVSGFRVGFSIKCWRVYVVFFVKEIGFRGFWCVSKGLGWKFRFWYLGRVVDVYYIGEFLIFRVILEGRAFVSCVAIFGVFGFIRVLWG